MSHTTIATVPHAAIKWPVLSLYTAAIVDPEPRHVWCGIIYFLLRRRESIVRNLHPNHDLLALALNASRRLYSRNHWLRIFHNP